MMAVIHARFGISWSITCALYKEISSGPRGDIATRWKRGRPAVAWGLQRCTKDCAIWFEPARTGQKLLYIWKQAYYLFIHHVNACSEAVVKISPGGRQKALIWKTVITMCGTALGQRQLAPSCKIHTDVWYFIEFPGSEGVIIFFDTVGQHVMDIQ